MMAPITKYIHEGYADLARATQDAFVVSICPDWTAERMCTVETASHANDQAAKATRKRHLVLCFAEEMDVIRLDAEMYDSATEPVAGCLDGANEGTA